jgi:hypothetical protein
MVSGRGVQPALDAVLNDMIAPAAIPRRQTRRKLIVDFALLLMARTIARLTVRRGDGCGMKRLRARAHASRSRTGLLEGRSGRNLRVEDECVVSTLGPRGMTSSLGVQDELKPIRYQIEN